MKMPEMEQPKEFSGKKKEFLKLTAGNHIIRLLPENEGFYITYTHWIHRANIECLGDECPICRNNKRIIAETGDNYRNEKEYSRRRQVFYVNVLDKTLAKVCPSCGEIHKPLMGNFPSVCSSCNAMLVNVEPKPLNKVVILNRGVELYDQLKTINSSVLDGDSGERVGIDNFDVMIMVPQKTKRPSASPLPHQNEKVEVPDSELFSLEDAPLHLEAGEIKSFLNGATLKDIFATRRANSAVEEEVEETFDPDDDDFMVSKEDVDKITPPWDEDDEEDSSEEDEIDVDSIEESVKKLFEL